MIIQVKNQLECMRYIQEYKPNCDSRCLGGCAGCSCSSDLWSITEKGKKAVEKFAK